MASPRLAALVGEGLGLGASTYDSMTGRAVNGLPPSAASGQPPMVNWDVVSEDWHDLQANMRDMGAQLEKGVEDLWLMGKKLGIASSPCSAAQGPH
jgi:hypothetical protein